MDSNKLKALKVVDLKAIAAKAKLQVPAKATKSDIIAKILASQAALDAYSLLYPSPLAQDDLLAPPEDVDWSEDPVVAPTPAVKEPKQLVADPEPPTPPPAVTDIDPELEKRQKRAERFGIPFIEPKKPSTPVSDPHTKKLEERAARFGMPAPTIDKKNLKRSAAQAEVDPEELERRRKRAERFGIAKIT